MKTINFARTAIFAALLVLGTANAQTATDTASTSNINNTHNDEGRGFNPSWLGLLGLAGLIGLRKRDTHAYSGASAATNRA